MYEWGSEFRSSRMQIFFKISVLKKFRNIQRKTPLLDCLFNKVAGMKACNFIKKETSTEMFLVNVMKFLRRLF